MCEREREWERCVCVCKRVRYVCERESERDVCVCEREMRVCVLG